MIPARMTPPLETKSLMLKVVAARRFTSLLCNLLSKWRDRKFTTAATAAIVIINAPMGSDPPKYRRIASSTTPAAKISSMMPEKRAAPRFQLRQRVKARRRKRYTLASDELSRPLDIRALEFPK